MGNTSQVARFIRSRIQSMGKPQKDIAREAGFDTPNMITMIKQGKTKLPISKVGPMAIALEADPVHLFQMCLEEYCPDTWKAIAPFMESALTREELRLITGFRRWVGSPYLAVLTEESKSHLGAFLNSLRIPDGMH